MIPETPIRGNPDQRLKAPGEEHYQTSLFDDQPEDEQLLADYRQRYGLAEDPFADDFSFPLFTAAGRREILDRLLHLCQFSNSLLVLLGEQGTGKTRMAHAFLDSLAEQDRISFLPVKPGQKLADLLPSIVEDLDLELVQTDQANLQACLVAYVETISAEDDGLSVVVIDDAHLLDTEALNWLMNWQVQFPQQQKLHFLLCGEPLLIDRLESIKPQSALLNDFFLQPFTLIEAVDYLNFRMEMADYLGPEIFTEAMVSPWWRQAQGHLGHLHDCAQERLLETVATQDKPQRVSALPVMHILAISAVIAIVGVLFLYLGEDKKVETASTSLPVPASITAVQASSDSSLRPLLPSLPEQQAPAQQSAQAAAGTAPNEALADQSLHQAQDLDQLVSHLPSSNLASPDEQLTEAQTAPEPQAKIAQSQPDTEPDPRANIIQAKPVIQPKPKPVVQSKPAVDEPPAVVASAQEQRILSWSPSSYTIQLLGVSSQRAAQDYVSKQSNKAQLLMFKSKRLGKDWFVVVTGNYTSIAQARAAIEELPSLQRKAGPWPRQLKVIQQEIRVSN